jgi:predicted TIM-barrel fold metal-dependent hydrolase
MFGMTAMSGAGSSMMPRRAFLANTAGALASALGGGQEPPGYIDAHVHVWTNDFRKYPLGKGWTPEQMSPSTYLPGDILTTARKSGVRRIVLIQMSYYGFDNSYMLDVIRSQPSVFRGVAVVDWHSPSPDKAMKETARQGIRGFRIQPGKEAPDRWLDGEGFQKMFRCGAEERLSICPLINPDALTALDRQCAKFPDTPVVIDHLARIGASQAIREADIKTLCALSRHKHVKVKLSAFYALGEKKPPHLDLIPLIRRVYEAFGSRRLMWASDCPFQTVQESYEDSIGLIRDRLDFLSAEDKEWILRRTAEESFWSF